MEFAARHHETLVQGGINREEVVSQAPLLADTMRKIVDAILSGESHVRLSSYNKKKREVSKKEKKFPIPKIEDLPHGERKKLSKAALHDALEFRGIDLEHDRIGSACREIQVEYRSGDIFSKKKLKKDAKMLVGAYFLYRKIDGDKGFRSTIKTIAKNPHSGAFSDSDILPTLKTVLQTVQKNTEIDYRDFVDELRAYGDALLEKYREPKPKKKID